MSYKLVGYFENWAQYRGAGGKFVPEQIDPTLFTHINFAFGLFNFVTWSVDPTETRTGDQRYTGDYSVQPVEWNDLGRSKGVAWKRTRQIIWKVTAKGEDTFQILAARDSSGPTSARLMSIHLLAG